MKVGKLEFEGQGREFSCSSTNLTVYLRKVELHTWTASELTKSGAWIASNDLCEDGCFGVNPEAAVRSLLETLLLKAKDFADAAAEISDTVESIT